MIPVSGLVSREEKIMQGSGFRVAKYDDDLKSLNDLMNQLMLHTREAMIGACEALNERNIEKAEFIAHNDDIIDHLDHMVHKTAHDLIMRYQPMARDLRQILASMRVASDLERIGDTAESIARRVIHMGDRPQLAVRRIGSLAKLVLERFDRLIEAYEARSAVNADDVRAHDDEIDAAYYSATADILSMMENDPGLVRTGAQLLSIAKSFERVGDRLTNIAEQILYEIDGQTEFAQRARIAQ